MAEGPKNEVKNSREKVPDHGSLVVAPEELDERVGGNTTRKG